MSRSLKKMPFVEERLNSRIAAMNISGPAHLQFTQNLLDTLLLFTMAKNMFPFISWQRW